MLAGPGVALFDRALGAKAALTLQKQFDALSPTQAADRASISSHSSPFVLLRQRLGLECLVMERVRLPVLMNAHRPTASERMSLRDATIPPRRPRRQPQRLVPPQAGASSARDYRAFPRAACDERRFGASWAIHDCRRASARTYTTYTPVQSRPGRRAGLTRTHSRSLHAHRVCCFCSIPAFPPPGQSAGALQASTVVSGVIQRHVRRARQS